MVITSALQSKGRNFESHLKDFDFICSFEMLQKEVQPDRSYLDCTLTSALHLIPKYSAVPSRASKLQVFKVEPRRDLNPDLTMGH